MPFNPQIHHRRSIRLCGYDYSQTGAYFITICCENRLHRFGRIIDRQMILNEYGEIAYHEWIALTERFINFELDVFQIMPNHIHGIIVLNKTPALLNEPPVGAGLTPALSMHAHAQPDNDIGNNFGQPNRVTQQDNRKGCPYGENGKNATMGNIVGAYKSLVVNKCLGIYKLNNETMGKFWQRNYHEHIIRNEQSYQTISKYIIHNPGKWAEDTFCTK